jgi:hypothetical protein
MSDSCFMLEFTAQPGDPLDEEEKYQEEYNKC